MCGRYTLSSDAETIAAHFALASVPADLAPRYNIAPAQGVPAVRLSRSGEVRLDLLRWGLIPSWAKDQAIGNRLINARAETVGSKPAFRAAFRRRRCLLPADGFYEWQRKGAAKQPHLIRRRDRAPFAMAGLWERWTAADGSELDSCTIITTAACELVRPIHPRMPVIIAPARYGEWLSREADAAPLAELLRPAPPDELEAFAVSALVNRAGTEDPRCIEPL